MKSTFLMLKITLFIWINYISDCLEKFIFGVWAFLPVFSSARKLHAKRDKKKHRWGSTKRARATQFDHWRSQDRVQNLKEFIKYVYLNFEKKIKYCNSMCTTRMLKIFASLDIKTPKILVFFVTHLILHNCSKCTSSKLLQHI